MLLQRLTRCPAPPVLAEKLQVTSVDTSKWLFGLQVACADSQDLAVLLSLTLTLAMVWSCGFRDFQPASTQDTRFKRASNNRTKGLAGGTL